MSAHKSKDGYKPSTDIVVSAGKRTLQTRLNSHRRIVSAVLAVTVIIVLAGVTLVVRHKSGTDTTKSTKTAKVGTVCEQPAGKKLMDTAAQNLDAAKVMDLQPAVQGIQKLPGYKADPNCLYVVLTYYINNSDATNARLYYGYFAKVYTTQTAVPISKDAIQPKDLEANIAAVEQRQKQARSNAFYSGDGQ